MVTFLVESNIIFKATLLAASVVLCAYAQYYAQPNMGGAVGCKVDAAYANIDLLLNKNGTLPVIPARPVMPAFCASNETTLYILGGCTVQNHKVYIGGKFARDLNEKEKLQLDEFARQMVAANFAAAQSAAAAAQGYNYTESAESTPVMAPPTTTISPITDAGRQIALDFCTEF